MVYCISYDLKKPGRDYNALYEAIKSYGIWWHQTDSVWFIVSKETSVDIRTKLIKHIDSNDKLFIIRLRKEWAAVGFNNKEYDWLKSISEENW